MAFAAEELRLARPLELRQFPVQWWDGHQIVQTRVAHEWVGADIDPKLLTVIGNLFHTLHYDQLDPLSDYSEFADIVANASHPAHETPNGDGVLYMFVKEYHPVPHEQPGQLLATHRGGAERFYPVRKSVDTLFPTGVEIFADELTPTGRQPAWTDLDVYLDMFFWRKTAITITNVAVVQENRQLKIGFLPLVDIPKPLTRDFVIYLEREFQERAGIHSGIFISSSEHGGFFMSTDRLFGRDRLMQVTATIGLMNHVEEGGIDGYVIDERHLDHMRERWPYPNTGIRIIPAPPIKPTIPRLTAIASHGRIEFLQGEKPSLLGRELLGAGLI